MPLDLPTPDHATLTRSPLISVICQIRFEEHPEASDPKVALRFQEALGGANGDYPTAQDLVGGQQRVTITVSPTGQPVADTRTLKGWRFTSKDTTSWAVTFLPDSVGLETTRYTDWEDFARRMAEILDALAGVFVASFEHRLGLRFVDRIQTDAATPGDLAPSIAPHLLGEILHPGLRDAVRGAQHSLLLDIGDEALCTLRHVLLPPEPPSGFGYLLDFDLYREGGRPFDVDAIKQTLDTFNERGVQLFQAAVTPELLGRLR